MYSATQFSLNIVLDIRCDCLPGRHVTENEKVHLREAEDSLRQTVSEKRRACYCEGLTRTLNWESLLFGFPYVPPVTSPTWADPMDFISYAVLIFATLRLSQRKQQSQYWEEE